MLIFAYILDITIEEVQLSLSNPLKDCKVKY